MMAIQANCNFMGQFVKIAAVQTDGPAPAKLRVAALRADRGNLVAEPNKETLRQVGYDFQKSLYLQRGKIVAEISHCSKLPGLPACWQKSTGRSFARGCPANSAGRLRASPFTLTDCSPNVQPSRKDIQRPFFGLCRPVNRRTYIKLPFPG